MDKILKKIVECFALLSAIIVMISFGVISSYYTGYLDYFGIGIDNIEFWPKINDFRIIGVSTILAIVILILLTYTIFKLINCLSKFLQTKNGWFKKIGILLYYSRETIFIMLAIILFYVTFNTVYPVSYKMGVSAASNKITFAQVNSNSNYETLIVYENNDKFITKQYNKSSKSFSDGYEILDYDGTIKNINIK